MSTPEQLSRLRHLTRAQHGVVTLAQAREAGLSDDTVRRRVATKAWRPAGPMVFQVGEHDETPASRTVAAVLSIGDAAVLVGRSAAWWHGLDDRAPVAVEVAVGRGHQVRPREGVDVLRRDIEAVDRTRLRRLAVTTRPRSVLDASVRSGLHDGAQLMDQALVRKRVTFDQLRRVHARTLGCRGSALAGTLLALAGGGARSEAERTAHGLMRRGGIRGWTANTEIVLPGYGRAIADVLFAAERVVVEIDGWAYHRDLPAFLRDGPRQSVLTAAGFVVLRTHWHQLVGQPDDFLEVLRRTLATRSPFR